MRSLTVIVALLCLRVAGQTPVSVQLIPWADPFVFPTDVAHCGDDRLFVAQQNGLIEIVVDSATVWPTPFLDLQAQVVFNAEQGLLGLAFDPHYTDNGFFYVHYVRDNALGHHSVISRFSVSADPNIADPNSEVVLYTWPQTTVAHKGGDLLFLPDGTLLITLGDGSMGGDPDNNAQDLGNPLGDILRIRPEADSTYSIPPDNPWVNAGGDTLPEIWASGLRNPFHIVADTLTGDLWIGDVGQSWWEELDRWSYTDHSGPNFGWRCYEGPQQYNASLCDTTADFVDAEVVHANILNGGQFCAVQLGAVYHGALFPRLAGRMLYTDYCSGQIRSLLPDGQGGWTDEQLLASAQYGMVGLYADHQGELWALNNYQHTLFKVVDPCPVQPTIAVVGDSLVATEGEHHTWYVDGVELTNDTSAVLVPQVAGAYWATVDLGNGCVFNTDTVMVSLDGLEEADALSSLDVVPNPATDRITVRWNQVSAPALQVDLMDALGRTSRSVLLRGGRAELDLAGLAPGVHFLRARTASGAVVVRRVVVR